MISHLEGTIALSGDKFIVLDVHGVGYKIHTTNENVRQAAKDTLPTSTPHPLGEPPSKEVGRKSPESLPPPLFRGEGWGGVVRFFTYLAVRENALDLYGFLTRQELRFFELLITVSGIGPKTALGIVNTAPVETLISGIASGDASYLSKVSGIGAKNAKKIVLELKDKIIGMAREDETGESNSSNSIFREESEVLEALQALGYALKDARDALAQVSDKAEKTVQEKIREALRVLGGRG